MIEMLRVIEISAHMHDIDSLLELETLVRFIVRLHICVEILENVWCVIKIKKVYMRQSTFRWYSL